MFLLVLDGPTAYDTNCAPVESGLKGTTFHSVVPSAKYIPRSSAKYRDDAVIGTGAAGYAARLAADPEVHARFVDLYRLHDVPVSSRIAGDLRPAR